MPIDLARSSTFDENGIALNDENGDAIAYIVASPDDPTVVGVDAPMGSLYLRTGVGTLYVKTGGLFTNWTINTTIPELSQTNLMAFAARHG